MGLVKKYITLDISVILRRFGRIIPESDIEIELIKLYKRYHYGRDNMIEKFTNKVLQLIFKDNKDRPYTDIYNFYKDKEYLTAIYTFIDFNTVLINRYIGPDYINVVFNKIKEYTKEKLIVEYEVLKNE